MVRVNHWMDPFMMIIDRGVFPFIMRIMIEVNMVLIIMHLRMEIMHVMKVMHVMHLRMEIMHVMHVMHVMHKMEVMHVVVEFEHMMEIMHVMIIIHVAQIYTAMALGFRCLLRLGFCLCSRLVRNKLHLLIIIRHGSRLLHIRLIGYHDLPPFFHTLQYALIEKRALIPIKWAEAVETASCHS